MSESKHIKRLLEEYRYIVDSPKNRNCRSLWTKTRSIVLDKWRGCPKENLKSGIVPLVTWIGFDIVRELTGLDIGRYHRDPIYFLENWLKLKIYYYNNFEDDNYYDNFIPIWLGEGFETTLFGMNIGYLPEKEPWIDRSKPVVTSPDDIDKLTNLDFRHKGLMPLAVRFYEEINEIVKDFDMDVGFVNWGNGPLTTCNYLRGYENMASDFLLNPEFARQILEFVSRVRIDWIKWRHGYLKDKSVEMCEMWDDDASVPNLSPSTFEEFILPAEKNLANFHRGISYYHNCGPADPYLESIKKLGKIELMHAGPFTNYARVAELFGHTSAIEHHVKSQEEGMNVNPENLEKRLKKVKDTYDARDVKAYTVRLTAYRNPAQTVNDDIKKIKAWIKVARKIFRN